MQKGKKLNPLTILFPVAIAAFGVYYIIKKSKTPKNIKTQATDFYAKNNNVKDTNVVKTNVKDTPKVESKTYLGELGDKLNNVLSFLKP
jgi:uncharacterized membrane protein YfbV (UPF0208 family)